MRAGDERNSHHALPRLRLWAARTITEAVIYSTYKALHALPVSPVLVQHGYVQKCVSA